MVEPDNVSPLVLILAGTTASGKTDVSIPLALSLSAEIVNADSRQVYRELIIGSAPPNAEQLGRVKHHFVGTKSISERWTAGDFARAARGIILSRAEAKEVTLVVGGSMMYLRALVNGLYEAEDEPIIDYKSLQAEWESRGASEMMQELQGIDPAIAATTQLNDFHRVLRAIGHYRATGKRLSEMRQGMTHSLEIPFRQYFLFGDRARTYARVNDRVDRMLAEGLVEEVRALWERGFDETNINALRTHGYQEVFPYLRGEIVYEAMREKIRQAVRHYVKRQLTWYRSNLQVQKVERSFDESEEIIAARILQDFKLDFPSNN